MDIIELSMQLIDEDTDQPRYQFDEEALHELMKSIDELGLLSPIKVRTVPGGRYKIIYGNRRYKASQMLGRPTIPCIVSNVTDETEIYLEQIAENLTREGFSPIEEAEAFHKLLNDPKFSSSTKFLSSRLGKPESYIKNKCELLKFGGAVKKLIVSGTDIRKDKLTEDQLLPLKDLPLEHRDALALIMARDEMPVSDVKKIAKLFKDKTISSGTKDKLLYKSGHELLETWSVYEQNRAERSKPAAAKAAKSEKAGRNEAAPADSIQAPPTGAPEFATAEAAVAEPVPQSPFSALSPLESRLQQLLAALPAGPLPESDAGTAAPQDQEQFAQDVDRLIETLESHLAAWKSVKELTKAAVAASAAAE